MKIDELNNYLIAHGYKVDKDDYDKDIFVNDSLIVNGSKTRMEIYTDYYTIRLRWWYEKNKRVGDSTYIAELTLEDFEKMIEELIQKVNRTRQPLSFKAYTDGSALNTSSLRPGGAAYIILDNNGNEVKRMSKGFLHTSSNRMELLAIISVVNSLPFGASVTIHSDSQYSINVLSGRWQAIENLDQIGLYRRLVSGKEIKVTFEWVKGHAGNQYNELCDQMAKGEYNKMLNSLSQNSQKSKKKSSNVSTMEGVFESHITTKGHRKRIKRTKK